MGKVQGQPGGIAASHQKIVVSGIVRDSLAGTSLPWTNVQVKGKGVGVPANGEGWFSLGLDEELAGDSIAFSLLGYRTVTLPIAALRTAAPSTIWLSRATTELAEVVVRGQGVETIVTEVSRRLKSNFPASAYEFEGYYRNAYQELGTYVRQQENAFWGYDPNFLQRSGHRVIRLAQRDSPDHRRFRWRQQQGNIPWHCYWRIRQQPGYFFAPQVRKHYHYQLAEVTTDGSSEVYKINITPKDSTERSHRAWAYVRASDYAILEIGGTTRIREPKSFPVNDTLLLAYTGGSTVVRFNRQAGKMYPVYSCSRFEHKVYHVRGGEQGSCNMEEEMIIHRVQPKSGYPSGKAFERDAQARTAGLPRAPVFWQTYNLPVATDLSRTIARDLAALGGADTACPPLAEEARPADAPGQHYSPAQMLDPAALRQDFTLLRNSLREVHPSLYRYTDQATLEQAFDSTFRLLTRPLTEPAFYRLLTPLLARIRCGHTGSRFSSRYEGYLAGQARYFPVGVHCAGQKLFVASVPGGNLPVRAGDEILSINGRATGEIIGQILPHLPADGYITTRKEMLLGSHFARLYHTFVGHEDDFALTVQASGGPPVNVTLPALPQPDSLVRLPDKRPALNAYRRIAPGAAVLRVLTFADGPGQPFKEWLAETFTTITGQSVTHLVVDLRDNEGGRDDYALLLLTYLMKKPFRYHTSLRAAADHFSFLAYTSPGESFNATLAGIVRKDPDGKFMLSAAHPTLGLHQPHPGAFQGKVYLLINGNTFSAAADVAALAQAHRQGVLIGQESGGAAAGNTSNGELLLTLPHSGIRVNIPLFEVTNAVPGTTLPGRGVIPQYTTPSFARHVPSQPDPEMALALRLITQP